MLKFVLVLLPVFLTWGCAARVAQMSPQQRSERLAAERGRVMQMMDAVKKTKSYITISEILLIFTTDAIRDGSTQQARTLLVQYATAIESARNTILTSKRDPQRKPGGYKELEIALRGQIRLLQDISKALISEERGPVEDAIATARSIRDEILQLLFPYSIPAAFSR